MGEMVKFTGSFGLQGNLSGREPQISSFPPSCIFKIKQLRSNQLGSKYPQLPSHHIHTAAQLAARAYSSFRKLARKSSMERIGEFPVMDVVK